MAYLWIYVLSIPVGYLLTSHFLHYKKKYFWYDYAAIFFLPGTAFGLLYFAEGVKVLYVLFFWVVFGPMIEMMLGHTYLKLMGRHLWIYEKFPFSNRTTSWLSLPFWAFGGLGMWALNRVLDIYFK